MGDRSSEATEPRDTEDLLEETDRLLSETGTDSETRRGDDAPARAEPSASAADPALEDANRNDGGSWLGSSAEPTDAPSGTDSADAARDVGSSRLPGVPSLPAASGYFSPKAFLALVLLTGAGLFAGATVVPIAGRIVGLFAAAFAVGLFASRRRYLEVGAAGTAVGGVSAVASNAFLAAAGSFQTVVAVGVGVGLVACLVGYYFGRDLRDGLSRDVH